MEELPGTLADLALTRSTADRVSNLSSQPKAGIRNKLVNH